MWATCLQKTLISQSKLIKFVKQVSYAFLEGKSNLIPKAAMT